MPSEPPPLPGPPPACPPPLPSSAPPALPSDSQDDGIVAALVSLANNCVKAVHVPPGIVNFSGRAEVKAFLGRTTVTYEATATLRPVERVVEFRESLTEKSSGLSGASFGASSETYSQYGTARTEKRKVSTLGGEYAYFYGALREAIEKIARQHGWSLKTTIL